MELKHYQKLVIRDLKRFISLLQTESHLGKAFTIFWEDKGIQLGPSSKMLPYQNIIPKVPHVCFKVPTGGGKTFLACHSVKPVFEMFSHDKVKVVLWMVPSDEIKRQTITNLSNPDHPYRQKLNSDFQNRVEIFTKEQLLLAQNFNTVSIADQLSICVLSYDSFRTNKKEGRKAYQENGNLMDFPNILGAPKVPVSGADETSLIQILNQFNPLVVVDESHHARSELSVEMLKNFNPCFVLDLTATPRKESNIISIVSALQLKKENMVKLPVIVYNRANKEQVIANAIDMQRTLEKLAEEEFNNGGNYLRPIVLFQAQPKGNADNTTYFHLKNKLVEVGIPEEHIAIQTANVHELNKHDLSSHECPIRYIITVNALKEGWDCPFAYILASLSNKSSSVDVEQILGRILRLPNAKQNGNKFLNLSYVLTSSLMFEETLGNIVKGLNLAGFSEKDYRAISIPQEDMIHDEPSENELFSEEDDTDENDFSDSDVKGLLASEEPLESTEENPLFGLAANANDEYKKAIEASDEDFQEDGRFSMTLDGDFISNRYVVNNVFLEDIGSIQLPQFFLSVTTSIFSETGSVLLTKALLSDGFNLDTQDSSLDWDISNTTLASVDVGNSDDATPKFLMLSAEARDAYFRTFNNLSKEGQINEVVMKIEKALRQINEIPDRGVHAYAERIVQNLTPQQREAMFTYPLTVAQKVKEKVRRLLTEYCFFRFKILLEQGKIKCDDSYKLPKYFSFTGEEMPLANALYSKEQKGNNFEQRFISKIASLENIRWWHRNIERTGYSINGPVNHYPDFIVRTTRGNILIIETKGDDRDNSDSRIKLELGRALQNSSGTSIKYYMVFDQNPFNGLEGAYTFDEFMRIVKEL